MAELKLHKCKLCGEPLDITKAVGGAVQCGYCGTMYTLPKETADDRLLNFLDSGELSLDKGDFEGAITSYSKAAEIDGNEPEANFGKALSKFKVRYIKDEVANRLQPICYEVTDKKFSDDPDYMRAYMKATPEQRAVYEEKAKDIDYIQSEFYNLKQSGLDYDCFICVKVTDDKTHAKTEDSKDADYIYHLLKDKGYKPFYSEYEIRNKQGADYEAHILYALYTSECMLVVCSDEEYLQTKWVKNEYSRFLKLVNDEEKDSDGITIVFKGKPIEKLPGKRGKLQGINFELRSADGQIVEFVDSHTPAARAKRAAEAEEKKRAAEEQKRELAEQRRMLEKSQRDLDEKISKLNKGERATVGTLLTRAWQEMDARNYDRAKGYFESALEMEPENSEGWRGLMCVKYKKNNIKYVLEAVGPFDYDTKILQSYEYTNWIKFADKDAEEKRVAKEFNDEMLSNLQQVKTEHVDLANRLRNQIAAANAEDSKELDEMTKEAKAVGKGKQNFHYYDYCMSLRAHLVMFMIIFLVVGGLGGYLVFSKYVKGEWYTLPKILQWGRLVGTRWGLLVESLVNAVICALAPILVIDIIKAIVAAAHNPSEYKAAAYYRTHEEARKRHQEKHNDINKQLQQFSGKISDENAIVEKLDGTIRLIKNNIKDSN